MVEGSWKLDISNWKFACQASLYKIITVVLIFTFSLMILIPAPAFAQQNQAGFHLVPCGDQTDADGNITNPCSFIDLIFLIYRIINFLLAASGAVALLMMLYYSFQMISSQGEPEAIAGAKTAMTRAVMGFAIILLSFVIMSVFLGIFGITCKPWNKDTWTGNSQGCLVRQ